MRAVRLFVFINMDEGLRSPVEAVFFQLWILNKGRYMAENVVPITSEGYQKLENELNYLRTVRRDEVAERLRLALEEGGDLTENAEYDDAKNEQAFIEGRILQLETQLSRAQIIDDEGPKDVVRLNSVVTVKEEGFEPETFHIVGPVEADPRNGKISDESPLGQALLGKKDGDKVTVAAPDGEFEYTILSVQ
jgi:transcription elongation factor GreA